MANMELLDKTYAFLKKNREFHKQKIYFSGKVPACGHQLDKMLDEMMKAENQVCGATGCLAGWGSLFGGYCQVRYAGWRPSVPIEEVRSEPDYFEAYSIDEDRQMVYIENGRDTVVDPATGEEYSMQEAATIAFDIDIEQARNLYSAYNSIEDLGNMIEALREDPDADLFELRGPDLDPDE